MKRTLTEEIAECYIDALQHEQQSTFDAFYSCPGLQLHKYEDITDAAALLLASSEQNLNLNGLTTFSESVAKPFTKHIGVIELNGIATVNEVAAGFLSQHRDVIRLKGLQQLTSVPLAKALSGWGNSSMPNSLKVLSTAAAHAMIQEDMSIQLNLQLIINPSIELVEILSHSRGSLALGLENLSEEIMYFLSWFEGDYLGLPNLYTITPSFADSLAAITGELALNGLRRLGTEQALALSKHDGILELNGLKQISRYEAQALSYHKGFLQLNGLESITDDVALELAKHKDCLSLQGIRKLSSFSATALAANPKIFVGGLTSLTTEAHGRIYQEEWKSTKSGVENEKSNIITHLTESAVTGLNAQNENCEFYEYRVIRVKSDVLTGELGRALAHYEGPVELTCTECTDAGISELAKQNHEITRYDLDEPVRQCQGVSLSVE